jgi:hypothetical protein
MGGGISGSPFRIDTIRFNDEISPAWNPLRRELLACHNGVIGF